MHAPRVRDLQVLRGHDKDDLSLITRGRSVRKGLPDVRRTVQSLAEEGTLADCVLETGDRDQDRRVQ